ncbi:hypothetical protein D9623_33745 (plasmid) [Azospirillum brasilense]|uniref:Uncharacterized protein n=1 Tax=Azospirillum brasilense TaxID=192 RepID=A0A4D8QPR1_AZOBR|nr:MULTISPECIES: hypothetical protein [Azospirillum]MDW7555405.1 hypothetical protein [Azospirillum brasilense]MDW7595187.1 hypothetical protein [Azospirillum brasilense]MDW7630340.1 hypothetical protein [Azospirillum brasilense]MDX5949708.1 hypothetical protein [Azospirillum brasilense]QCO12868.1 hypothetical protein D3868_28070 [Azospirillum brasilense]
MTEPYYAYSAKSRAHLKRLAEAAADMPACQKIAVTARCFADGLMVMPFWVRISLALAIWRHGRLLAYFAFFSRMDKAKPGAADDAWDQIIRHMLDGKDTEQPGSVGGFCQRELDMFVGYLRDARRMEG